MKTLLVNISDAEGGAARVTRRLHQSLLRNGVDSRYLVQFATTNEQRVVAPAGSVAKLAARLRPELDALPLAFYPKARGAMFSPSIVPDRLQREIRRFNPDIVHLNWICRGFIRIESLARLQKPVVWTLHDSWAFTGGCHVPQSCVRYREGCGRCPQLGSSRLHDLSRRVFRRKSRSWRTAPMTIVCPSSWLASCARSSPLFKDSRIEVIPNGIDLEVYKPTERGLAREILGLPKSAKLVLFGAMSATSDRNKGFVELVDAVRHLARLQAGVDVRLAVFGASEPEKVPDFGIPCTYMGRLFDDASIALLCSASDVFVAPSLQENLPTTVMEAMSCGTPTVAFDCSGFPDLILHHETGYLAKPYDSSDLARGIDWILSDPSRSVTLGAQARKRAEDRFGISSVTRRYVSLYEELAGGQEDGT